MHLSLLLCAAALMDTSGSKLWSLLSFLLSHTITSGRSKISILLLKSADDVDHFLDQGVHVSPFVLFIEWIQELSLSDLPSIINRIFQQILNHSERTGKCPVSYAPINKSINRNISSDMVFIIFEKFLDVRLETHARIVSKIRIIKDRNLCSTIRNHRVLTPLDSRHRVVQAAQNPLITCFIINVIQKCVRSYRPKSFHEVDEIAYMMDELNPMAFLWMNRHTLPQLSPHCVYIHVGIVVQERIEDMYDIQKTRPSVRIREPSDKSLNLSEFSL